MRSSTTTPSSRDGDDDDSKPLFSCFYWWRSLVEFDLHGRPNPDLFPDSAKFSSLTPRLRVIKEMERLALVANESLDDLRHKLITYRSGDLWFPAGGIPKPDTDIPPVITVLLVGFAGSGKSSLVNLMYSVLGRSGIVPFAQTSAGKDGRTLCLEEHNVLRSIRNGFCIFDSKGLSYDRVGEGLEEVSEWMEAGVRHRQLCQAGGIDVPAIGHISAKRFVQRRVNCVVVIANVSKIYKSLKAGDRQPLEATRELFHSPSIRSCYNENPILVLTHGDELTAEERIEGRVKTCEFLGVSETTGAYDVACLNEHGVLVDEMDPVTAYAVAEVVYRALLVADRSHPPKRRIKDWFLFIGSWAIWCLSAFFAFMAYCCSTLARRHHKPKLRM